MSWIGDILAAAIRTLASPHGTLALPHPRRGFPCSRVPPHWGIQVDGADAKMAGMLLCPCSCTPVDFVKGSNGAQRGM